MDDSDNEIDIDNLNSNNNQLIIDNNLNLDLNSNINILNEDDIVTVEEEVEVENYEKVYSEDRIYIKEIENQLLGQYKISMQSNYNIQKNVVEKAVEIIDLKNYGQEVLDNKNKFLNPLIKSYYNKDFNQNWIIPVILDKKRVYRLITSNNNNNSSKLITESKLKEGIDIIDQKSQFLNEKELDKTSRIIDTRNYFNKLINMTEPYISNNNDSSGYNFEVKKYSEMLRFNYLDTIYWTLRKVRGITNTTYEHEDEKKGVIEIAEKKLLDGELLNLIGFMVLPYKCENILCITDSKDKNKFYNYGKIGNITKIKEIHKGIIEITCDNHKLIDGQKIMIKDSNTIPSINGIYIESVNIIDDNIFNIQTDISKITDGDKGEIDSILPLKYNINNF